MIAIFGHQNPDTDAICSAIVAADYFTGVGYNVTAFRLGSISPETEFVLKKIGVKSPELLKSIDDGSDVILVDHNMVSQSLPNLQSLNVLGYIDHHAIENISSPHPIYVRFEPLGSTCSILYRMYTTDAMMISKPMAALMLSGILSDTLGFRSPTTTDDDKKIAEQLASIAGVSDIESYAFEMFAAKSNVGHLSDKELITTDFKVYEPAGKMVGLGVVETTNPEQILKRKDGLLKAMQQIKEEKNLDFILLSVIDILEESNTTFVLSGEEEALVQQVFSASTNDNVADLGSRVSRKKQMQPQIEDYLNS
jgi:manganese-dependent inorganic pyrophosphatase